MWYQVQKQLEKELSDILKAKIKTDLETVLCCVWFPIQEKPLTPPSPTISPLSQSTQVHLGAWPQQELSSQHHLLSRHSSPGTT